MVFIVDTITYREQFVRLQFVFKVSEVHDSISCDFLIASSEETGGSTVRLWLQEETSRQDPWWGDQTGCGEVWGVQRTRWEEHVQLSGEWCKENYKYTLVNIWSGSKKFIKVVLRLKHIYILGQLWRKVLIHFKCWLVCIYIYLKG